MQKLRFSAGLAVMWGVLAMMASVCHAQTNATVTGEVKDSSGALVPHVIVSITNISTDIRTKAETNDQGLYRIQGLIPGTYRAEISKDGFKGVKKNDIELHALDSVEINFTLEVGSASESVTVEAGAPLIETQSTSIGDTVEGRQVQEAPLNGRNPMNMLDLIPGIIPENLSAGNPADNQGSNNTQPSGYGAYLIGGGVNGQNATFIDGANEDANGGTNIAIVPTQDSVNEFHVDSNAVSPQFGGFAGGVVSFSTKSGTNNFHGTAYEYWRNTILNANTWVNDHSNLPVPPFYQNQFGANVGGPIIKNKTFFFFSWEQFRLETIGTQLFRVPTPAEQAGDFTADFGTTTDGIHDYYGYNGTGTVPGPEACPGGSINKLCPQHLSPAVQQMYKLNYYRPVEPNASQLAIYEAEGDNQGVTSRQPNNEKQYVARIDHNLSDKQKLFGRYTYWNTYIPNCDICKMPAIPTQPTFFTSQQIVVGDTYTLTPSLIADVRLSYNRWSLQQSSNGNGTFNMAQYGANWAAVAPSMLFHGPVTIFDGSGFWANMPNSKNLFSLNPYNNYALSLNLTKVTGKHSVTFGGEVRRIETYTLAVNNPTGNFYFDKDANYNPLGLTGTQAYKKAGAGIAELDSGQSDFSSGNTYQGNVIPADAYNYYQGYYVTDAWRVSPKLTVNIGVRWELPGTWLEKHDHNSVLLGNVANPIGTIANMAGGPTQLKGIIAPVNSTNYSSRGQSQIHYGLFNPRLGVNYSLDSKTVVRAGFGLSNPCISCGSTTPTASPLSSATTLNPTGFSSIDNPYPTGLLQPLGRSTHLMDSYSSFPQTLLGTPISGEEPNQKYTYFEQWNLAVERSIGNSISALVGYIGSRGAHIGNNVSLNQLPDSYASQAAANPTTFGAQLLSTYTAVTGAANPLLGIAAPGRVGSATSLYGQFLTPYPEFAGVTSSGKYFGESSYNALVAQFKKHFSAGATVNVSYTWSHFITNGEGGYQDYNNLRADRSNSTSDIPHYLAINYILDAPFGKGKHFLNSAGPVVDRIVGGWQLSGITVYESGFPLAFTSTGSAVNNLTNNFYAGTTRPSVVAGVSKAGTGSRFARATGQGGATWFNTGAFMNAGPWAFGNESRVDSTLRADPTKNWDMNLAKNTAIKEGIVLQFKAEYFNAFNHPQYNAPVVTYGAGNFGTIPANSANGATNLSQPRIGQLSMRLTF
jgi:hypothetical protein